MKKQNVDALISLGSDMARYLIDSEEVDFAIWCGEEDNEQFIQSHIYSTAREFLKELERAKS